MSHIPHTVIQEDADFKALVTARRAITWPLAAVVSIAYFAFILAIAFDPKALAVPVTEGHVGTNGIWLGMGLILLCLIVTGIYLHKANTVLDELTHKVQDKFAPTHTEDVV